MREKKRVEKTRVMIGRPLQCQTTPVPAATTRHRLGKEQDGNLFQVFQGSKEQRKEEDRNKRMNEDGAIGSGEGEGKGVRLAPGLAAAWMNWMGGVDGNGGYMAVLDLEVAPDQKPSKWGLRRANVSVVGCYWWYATSCR